MVNENTPGDRHVQRIGPLGHRDTDASAAKLDNLPGEALLFIPENQAPVGSRPNRREGLRSGIGDSRHKLGRPPGAKFRQLIGDAMTFIDRQAEHGPHRHPDASPGIGIRAALTENQRVNSQAPGCSNNGPEILSIGDLRAGDGPQGRRRRLQQLSSRPPTRPLPTAQHTSMELEADHLFNLPIAEDIDGDLPRQNRRQSRQLAGADKRRLELHLAREQPPEQVFTLYDETIPSLRRPVAKISVGGQPPISGGLQLMDSQVSSEPPKGQRRGAGLIPRAALIDSGTFRPCRSRHAGCYRSHRPPPPSRQESHRQNTYSLPLRREYENYCRRWRDAS